MYKIVFVVSLVLPFIAFCMDLPQARSSKLIAEDNHGYIQALDSSEEVKLLVNEVNAKRKAEYIRITKESGASLDEVEALSAKRIIDSLPEGSKIMVNGQVLEK